MRQVYSPKLADFQMVSIMLKTTQICGEDKHKLWESEYWAIPEAGISVKSYVVTYWLLYSSHLKIDYHSVRFFEVWVTFLLNKLPKTST